MSSTLHRTVALLIWAGVGVIGSPALVAAARPNFIFFLLDDLRVDGTGVTGHPFASTPQIDRIAREGLLFRNAFVATPLCSPSRASFLTGKYARSHGVRGNGTDLDLSSQIIYPALLQANGYATAFLGKWHMGNNPNPRPGFDYWVSFPGQGVYFGTTGAPLTLTIGDGGSTTTVSYTGTDHYNTDLLTDYADNWLRRSRSKPFCLLLHYKAVHGPRDPAPRHENLYANGVFPVPLSANADPTGKPSQVRDKMLAFQALTPTQQQNNLNNAARKDQQVLAAVDESVGRLLATLTSQGVLDNTVVVWTSDNGYFFKEFGLDDKRWQYEPSIRIPWLVRYPPMIAAGRVSDLTVLNIDLAETFLDLAGVPIPASMQGRSLRPIFEDTPSSWRTSWLTEYFQEGTFIQPTMDATAMNGGKFIHYPGNPVEDELYNLLIDPNEITNVIGQPSYASQLASLQQERERLVNLAAGSSPDSPYVDLGTANAVFGLQPTLVGDGDTQAVTIGGRDARKNLDPSQDHYMYFAVTDTFAFQGNKPDVYVNIVYFDAGSGTLTLQYDSASAVYTSASGVSLTGTNTWKQKTWHVSDAWFGNRQNGQADFRINGGSTITFYLDTVQVSSASPGSPFPAGNPNPANGATDVNVRAQLSWSTGPGALSYHVYFGTTSPPPLLVNQQGTSIAPGPLVLNTTYFWRIDPVNGNGTTLGDTWSFTTETPPPPGKATGPNPSDGATGIHRFAKPSWTAGVGATLHNVYFGTTSPGTLRIIQETTTFNPGRLDLNTTYFWRVDEVRDGVTTTGDVWSFRTVATQADLDGDGDVDQSDFGEFQRCLSGGYAYPAGCEDADLNQDNHVEAADLELFLRCMAGPGRPPGC